MKKLILVVPSAVGALVVVSISLLITGCFFAGLMALLLALILNESSETFAYKGFHKTEGNLDFKILTFNVNRAYEFSKNKGNSHELLHAILQHNPDIILLQEFNSSLYPEIYEKLVKEYPYGGGKDSSSRFKSVFSRFPIDSANQLCVDEDDKRFLLFRSELYPRVSCNGKHVLPICKMLIDINGYKIQVFNCHLMSNNLSVELRNIRDKKNSLISGLFSVLRRFDYGYECRELQMEIVKENVDNRIPVIVCGDFNDIGGSSVIQNLEKVGFKDVWWQSGFGLGHTFHGLGLRFRLDHILYSSNNLKAIMANVIETKASDHLPLIASFTFG